MVYTPSAVCFLVAVILFVLAAFPPISHFPLLAIGLAFFAAGELLR